MRYVVYGAGAVGGVVGGRLALAGHPVTLVARGVHLEAIKAGGLVLDAGDGRHRIDAPATDTAAEVRWTDDTVVLLSVKSHQAAAALSDLRAHAPADVPIVCLTNGIATEAAALRLFARTYAVCVMLPASHLEPGVVVASCHPTPRSSTSAASRVAPTPPPPPWPPTCAPRASSRRSAPTSWR